MKRRLASNRSASDLTKSYGRIAARWARLDSSWSEGAREFNWDQAHSWRGADGVCLRTGGRRVEEEGIGVVLILVGPIPRGGAGCGREGGPAAESTNLTPEQLLQFREKSFQEFDAR